MVVMPVIDRDLTLWEKSSDYVFSIIQHSFLNVLSLISNHTIARQIRRKIRDIVRDDLSYIISVGLYANQTFNHRELNEIMLEADCDTIKNINEDVLETHQHKLCYYYFLMYLLRLILDTNEIREHIERPIILEVNYTYCMNKCRDLLIEEGIYSNEELDMISLEDIHHQVKHFRELENNLSDSDISTLMQTMDEVISGTYVVNNDSSSYTSGT